MSSLFQGFTNPDGRVRTTTLDPDADSVIYRGIALDAPNNAVHVSLGRVPSASVGGVPVGFDGVVCITDTAAPPDQIIPGGLALVNGRLYLEISPGNDPSVIHQGVGLRTGGRLCRINV